MHLFSEQRPRPLSDGNTPHTVAYGFNIPAVFASPDTFQMGRQKNASHRLVGKGAHHLAFGAGMHVCVGAAFSLLQLELTASLLLDQLDGIRFAPGFVYREEGLYTRGPSALCVEFRARAAGAPETAAEAEATKS